MGLVLGPLDGTILVVVKEAQQEERDPCALVVTNSMNQEKGRGKMTMNLAGNGVHHSSSMSYSKDPERPRHLFICQICMGHMHHDFPMGFHQTVRRLTPSGCSNDLGGVINQTFLNCCTKEFQVTITAEISSKRPHQSTKEANAPIIEREDKFFKPNVQL
jgi:hypothetical protein